MDTSLLPTALLVTVLLALFVYGWVRSERGVAIASLLVSIGLFGTFLGIAYALFGFDTSAIDESVPTLLSGMRLAFVTSVVGLFFAVMLRARAIIGAPSDDSEMDDMGALLRQLTTREEVGREEHREIADLLRSIRVALSGAGKNGRDESGGSSTERIGRVADPVDQLSGYAHETDT